MSVSNGWTGGQYSLYRVAFGGYLLLHFAALAPWGAELFSSAGVLPDSSASPLIHLFPNILALWDSPAFVTALLIVAAVLSLLLAVGVYDRAAAIALWYLLACFFGRNPLIANPALPYVGWLLLAHAALPPAPYGAWAARSRTDPGGGWHMPQGVFVAAWIVMALGYSYSGYTKLVSPSWVDGTALVRVLENPLARPGALREFLVTLPPELWQVATWGALALELLFAPLALFRRLRPWIWAIMVAMHLSLMALINFADLSLGMVMLHGFTFDPGWVRLPTAATETIFYDGHCVLCHRFVRFALAEDRGGTSFRFAPLGGGFFQATVPESERGRLPDSVVVRDAQGRLLVRSRAALHVLRRLGGIWRVAALLDSVFPTAWLDVGYDAVARVRYRIFGQAPQACPLLPPNLRARFEM